MPSPVHAGLPHGVTYDSRRYCGQSPSWTDIIVGTSKYPPELRERAVRLYREPKPKPVIRRLAKQLNVYAEALRNWIRQDQADHGERDDRQSTAMLEENRRVPLENAGLRRVNEVLRAASAYFAAEFDPPRKWS